MGLPLVSVVMPAYNAETTIAESIRSLADCGTRDFELIVVDDGSEISVESYVRQAANDINWSCYRNSINGGLSTAANIGVSVARGRYIARLDADDLCVNRRIAVQVEYLEKNKDIAFCGTYYQHFGADDRFVELPTDYDACVAGLAVRCIFGHSSTLIHRDRAGAELYYDPTHPSEDYDLWLRMFVSGLRGVNLPFVGLMYRQSSTSYVKTNTEKRLTADYNIRVRAVAFMLEKSSSLQAIIIGAYLNGGYYRFQNDLNYFAVMNRVLDEAVPKELLRESWNILKEYCLSKFPSGALPEITELRYRHMLLEIISTTRAYRR